MTKIWSDLRRGHLDEAIRSAREEYEASGGVREFRHLACSQIYASRLQSACATVAEFRSRHRYSTDIDAKISGTALWLLGNYEGAVREWIGGLHVDYADTAGGVTVPLHLMFADAMRPETQDVSEALALMNERARLARDDNVVAAYVRVANGDLTVGELLSLDTRKIEHIQKEYEWVATFWRGVGEIARGSDDYLRTHLPAITELELNDPRIDDEAFFHESAFANKVVSTEYYLALWCDEALRKDSR